MSTSYPIIAGLTLSAIFAQGPVKLMWNPASIAGDPSLVEFQAALERAVESRDSKQLLALLAPRVGVAVEKILSRDAAITALGLHRQNERWWRVLRGAVRLGGTLINPTTYVLPFHGGNPYIDVGYGWCLATDNVISVRARPSQSAAEIATLNHDVVKYANPTPTDTKDWQDWHLVYLWNGREGYVDIGDCIGPMGVHIYVEKVKGLWRITVLSRGD